MAPVASLGSRSSTVLRSSSRVEPTLDPSESPPSCSAFTGDLSNRLEVSAACRMSLSPMVRTSVAFEANSGDRGAAFISESR